MKVEKLNADNDVSGKKKSNNRHIPSRYITYHFVCRNCGKSDVGEFDKFTDPKNSYILCNECKQTQYVASDFEEWDFIEDDELPF